MVIEKAGAVYKGVSPTNHPGADQYLILPPSSLSLHILFSLFISKHICMSKSSALKCSIYIYIYQTLIMMIPRGMKKWWLLTDVQMVLEPPLLNHDIAPLFDHSNYMYESHKHGLIHACLKKITSLLHQKMRITHVKTCILTRTTKHINLCYSPCQADS